MPAELFRKQENDKESIGKLFKFFTEGNITLELSERNLKIESIGHFFKVNRNFSQQLKIRRCAATQLYTMRFDWEKPSHC